MYIDKSKAKKHQVQYRTSIVVAVRRRWWCPSMSVRSGGQPSLWSSVVLGGGCPSPSVVIGGHLHCASSSVAIHRRRHRHPSPSTSPSVVSHCCPLSVVVVVGRRCQLSLSVFVVGLRRWLSVIVIVVVLDLSLVVVIGCQLSVIIIVAVGHGRECDRCATSRGRCTFMAEGTTSVEPAGRAEKATAARHEALV